MTICETGVRGHDNCYGVHFYSNTEYTGTIKPLPFKLIWRLLCTLIIHILRELSEGLLIFTVKIVHVPCLVAVNAHILSQAALSFFFSNTATISNKRG